MQIIYHGKGSVDTVRLNTENLCRASEIDSLDQLASVVGKSVASKEVFIFSSTDGEWLDSKTLTSNYFIPYRGIRKCRHFVFQAK
jgi:hypothetical protein